MPNFMTTDCRKKGSACVLLMDIILKKKSNPTEPYWAMVFGQETLAVPHEKFGLDTRHLCVWVKNYSH